MTTISAAATSLLAFVLAGSDGDIGHAYVGNTPETNELLQAGYIEVRTDVLDAAGNAAARITGTGRTALTEAQSAAQTTGAVGATDPKNNKPVYERVRMAVPADEPRKPGGNINKEERYAFGDLLPLSDTDGMDAIFVPATEKMKNPFESLQSAVSAANRRYAEIIGERTTAKGKKIQEYNRLREFKVYPSNDPAKPGAFIGRVDKGDLKSRKNADGSIIPATTA